MFAHQQTRSAHDPTLKRPHSDQVKVFMPGVGVFIASMWFYPVRELVAAVVIFSILFITMGMAFLTLFLIEKIALKGVARLEARVAYARSQHTAVWSQRDKDMF